MLKRVIAIAVVFVGALAAPAAAQQYPPAENQVTISDACVPPGGSLTVTAGTFTPGSSVSFTLALAPLGTVTADASGIATVSATVPSDATEGEAAVAVAGEGATGPLALSGHVTIDADDCAPAPGAVVPAGPAGTNLPRTGSDVVPLVQIGLALAALGGLTLAVASKRRRSTSPA
ncbi:MAG TPA: LPXTG cell wall anchor domain-containing protein [Acidimicrobiales bacterium]|nr:LPXTG cell wall anchor domain-containing protein [Acidimicrobiales bacterium]